MARTGTNGIVLEYALAADFPVIGTSGQLYLALDTDILYSWQSPSYIAVGSGSSGVTDHGALTGLSDDDHTQYYNQARGDARYSQLGHTHTASQVTDFDTEVSNNTDVSASTAARHTHANSAVLAATTASFLTADETKLDGIEAGADVTDATNVAAAGAFMKATDDADDIADGTTNKLMTATERTKLAGIATGATANSSDATLLSRANHTGTQTASTVSDFNSAALAAAPAETATTIGTLISGATDKATPIDADSVALSDSAASNILKKLSWSNIKATLKTYFDTLYATTAQANATHTGDVTGSGALTIDKTAITGKTTVTAVGADYVLISDTSDSGNIKKSLVSDFSGLLDGDKGDITVSGATWTIDDGAVTLAKQAGMATSSIVYRKTAGTGAPEIQTLSTLKTDLGLSGTNSGDQTITLTGDVTGSGDGSFGATIANDAVTYAKIQNVSATDKILGRSTAGAGNVEEITCTAAGRTLLGDVDAAAQRTTLGLVIGTDVQAYDADLTTWAGKTAPSGAVVGDTDTQTVSGKTLTAPKIVDGGYIADGNGNEVIKVSQTSSAVNEFTVKNAATGNAPELQVTGGDANIDLKLVPKGSGKVVPTASVNFGAKTAYFTETDNSNSSTADTIDWGVSNKQKSTLTGNCTFTFTAPPGPCSLILKLIQDGTGSRTVTWPAAVHWPGGTAPTLTTTASRVDLISFYYDGTTYFGNSSLNYTP